MQSKATTVEQYIAELPADRRAAIQAVREVILKNLDKGYVERMSYGMIGYAIPHSIYPHGYHCDPKQPLPFAGLASQKQHMSMHLMSLYEGWNEQDAAGKHTRWFKEAWAKAGKKLDMGKACIRFKQLDDVPLEVVGEAIRRTPVKTYIEFYEAALRDMGKTPDGKKIPGGKPASARPRSAKADAAKPTRAKKKIAKKAAKKTAKKTRTRSR
ncbi:MAG: DUF1801 domain-containing protein [Phycisphaerales bacterium]|nr:DUF1801 domain-containing protein [Phycisphaerales bacterium]